MNLITGQIKDEQTNATESVYHRIFSLTRRGCYPQRADRVGYVEMSLIFVAIYDVASPGYQIK